MNRQSIKNKVYLNIAREVALLSKDKNSQIGAVIVGKDGTPVSWGYNGTVQGFDDALIPHSREYETLSYMEGDQVVKFKENKYPFMEHAERNALDFADPTKLAGSTLYVTGFPCEGCALRIAKRKVARVVIAEPPASVDPDSSVGVDVIKSKFIFVQAGIEVYVGNKKLPLSKHVIV